MAEVSEPAALSARLVVARRPGGRDRDGSGRERWHAPRSKKPRGKKYREPSRDLGGRAQTTGTPSACVPAACIPSRGVSSAVAVGSRVLDARVLAATALGVLASCALWVGCGPSTRADAQDLRPPERSFSWVEFPQVARAGQVHVVFDQSVQTLSSPLDVRFAGLSRFAVALEREGAVTSLSHQPPRLFLPQFCAPGRVVVLGIPWKQAYSERDQEALEVCVRNGAGVLVFAEHDNIYAHADLVNPLLERFGVTVQADAALGAAAPSHPLEVEWPLADSDALGVRSVQLYLPAPLGVRAPAASLLELRAPAAESRAIVGAIAELGEGRLAVVGDLEVFWNMTPGTGVQREENLRFCLALVRFLAGRPPGSPIQARSGRPPLPEALPPEWASGEKRAFFEASAGSMVPDGRPNGLTGLAHQLSRWGYRIEVGGDASQLGDYGSFDLVVVAAPREPLSRPERIASAQKLLLVGDGQQDLFAAEPELRSLLPLDVSSEPDQQPLNALAPWIGFEFLDVTLLSPAGSFFVRGTWSEREAAEDPAEDRDGLWVVRAAALRLHERSESSRVRILATAEAGAEAVLLLSPVHRAPEGEALDFTATPARPAVRATPVPGEAWPLIVQTDRVMALADLELLTDSELGGAGGPRLKRELRHWLER